MKNTIFMMILLVLISGCAPAQKGVLEGRISIGPLCPVESIPPRPECQPTMETFNARPIDVLDNGRVVMKLNPDSNGNYRIELPEGNYMISLENHRVVGHSSLPVQVTIKHSEMTELNIDIDTGIR